MESSRAIRMVRATSLMSQLSVVGVVLRRRLSIGRTKKGERCLPISFNK